ncbi:hypothetical protein KC722_03445 [Candidatus Kaiserbacteria bacterium]|nr:hypothetical protein [Candidatus Kaiserbacteria bacterium]
MPPYATIEKAVGETPLEALERLRAQLAIPTEVPMAYAGRLDPMASGTLLVLIGDECKRQEHYHQLDKAYEFEVLFGTRSDTGDVLGLLTWERPLEVTKETLDIATTDLTGKLELPYPLFSSKTVGGKPLHTWTLEGRLDEIEIPIARTTLHRLTCTNLRSVVGRDVYEHVNQKIDTIPEVTDERKQLGADFRRKEVHLNWDTWLEYHKNTDIQIATFSAICSSGTYMRSLAEEIGRRVGVSSLAYSIHRSRIGQYQPLPLVGGFWKKRFK